MRDYIICGLTGQSGAGKTTVSNAFKDGGFAIINCDEISKNVTNSGSDCNKELALLFPQCFDESYTLDRQKMAEIVFNDKGSLATLNKTIFPYITREIVMQIGKLANQGKKYILLDAPTLFEAKADSLCDAIISCIANKDIRAKRIAMRDNISEELIASRFDSQKDEQFFIDHSDYVIENNGDMNSAILRVNEIIESIKRKING